MTKGKLFRSYSGSEVRICTKCVFDENIGGISFDTNGVCNYCKLFDQLLHEYPGGAEGEKDFKKIVDKIKYSGRKRKYDCVVGISGGADSSYLLFITKKYGLRPLAVHYDNTWNSTTSTENIRKVTKKLNVDLYTHVVNNKEIDDIYMSFFKASVKEIEAPTDIGLAAVLYMAAEKYRLKYIIEGHSFRTEGIGPLDFAYMDGKYIESIQKQFGSYKIQTFPNMKLFKFIKWIAIKRIRKIRPLWYLDYDKEEAKKFLNEEFGWEWYGGHHLENRMTAFKHSYWLPNKFQIDSRIIGYSAYIRAGMMTKEEALIRLEEPPYLEPELLDYLKKRLGLSEGKVKDLIDAPNKTFRDYKTYKRTFEKMRLFFYIMSKMDLVPKSFYIKFCSASEI